ncbi:MAG: LacI family DNA-binding transcriptional regulator [Bacteroidales bacterium]
MKKQRVSLDDIARSVGVSKAVVSLVLNGKGQQYGISERTRIRVLDMAKDLNYKPNQLARGLRLGYTNTIGLIVSDISNVFYAAIARNIEDLAAAIGYNVIICSTDEDVEKELKLIKLLRNRQVDGIILSSSQKNVEELNNHYSEGLPLVLIDRYFENSGIPSVVVDNYDGGTQIAGHLYDTGYIKPMVLTLSTSHVSTVKHRVDGYCDAWRQKGINAEVVEIPFGNIEESVKDLLSNRLMIRSLPDCLFAVNNNLATAVLQTCSDLGLKIPADMALTCFDDLPYFRFIKPSVTAVSQPIVDICNKAFELLMYQVKQEEFERESGLQVFPIKLNIRESSHK